MTHFFTELQRRNVHRAALFYAGAVWLLIQVATQVFPFFDIPNWAVRAVIIAALIGFPFAMLFSWFYGWTPQGIRRESEIDRNDSTNRESGKKIDRWIFAVMGLAIVLLLTDRLMSDRANEPLTSAPAFAAIPEIDKDPSIAVMPLRNLSADKDQEYFSDGISEDLLNLLSKVPKLRVIARSSSFSFKGKDALIPDIARALVVAAVLEGSVRRNGNTVRISVQLIRASDSTQLWSETYDRTLDDIFKVQDEIAAAVVDKLRITLLGAAPIARPVDPRAYPLILQAKAIADSPGSAGHVQAIALYRQALAISPDEPRALSGLGRIYLAQALYGELPPAEGSRLAKEVLRKAIELDPNDGLAYSRLASVLSRLDADQAGAAALHQKALQLDPTNLSVIGNAASFLQIAGQLDEAIKLDEYRAAHDPANPSSYGNLGNELYTAGRWAQAIAAINTALALSPDYAQVRFAGAIALLASGGDANHALKEMQRESDEVSRMTGIAIALHTLGRKADSDAALAAAIAQHGKDNAYSIAGVHAWRGEADLAFEWIDKAIANQEPFLVYLHIEPLYIKLRKDPRWLPLLRRLGQTPEQLAKIQFKVTLPDAGSGNRS